MQPNPVLTSTPDAPAEIISAVQNRAIGVTAGARSSARTTGASPSVTANGVRCHAGVDGGQLLGDQGQVESLFIGLG